jgi:hypothetical protein
MRTLRTLAALGIAVALSACGSSGDPGQLGNGDPGTDPGVGGGDPTGGGGGTGTGGGGGSTTGGGGGGGGTTGGGQENLDRRVVDYGEALRTASLKLVGELPTLAQIKALDAATDKKAAYEAEIDKMLADPRFTTIMIKFWKDTFRTGQVGQVQANRPNFDSAAIFAAQVVVQDRPYTDLFTATTGTCPTYANGTFTPADCPAIPIGQNAAVAPTTVGILTDPGLMAQYYANMAFRRIRFVQETFKCTKYPAEFTNAPKQMGAGTYTSPWDFNSITNKTNTPNAKIDFGDTSAVICANCHTTLNHRAAIVGGFAYFDMNGGYSPTQIQVQTPVVGTPRTVTTDWIPASEKPAYKFGIPVNTLTEFGAELAKDPEVAQCAVNRIWNYAFSRGDIVNDLATIPSVVTDPLVKDFTANGQKLKRVIRNVFTSDDFVKF